MFQLADSMSPGTPLMEKRTFRPISGLAGLKLMVGLMLPLPTGSSRVFSEVAESALLVTVRVTSYVVSGRSASLVILQISAFGQSS